MSNFADTNEHWRKYRDQQFIAHIAFGSPMAAMITALSPPKPVLSEHELMIRNLDYQHDRVRDAFAVLRGEAEIGESY